MSINSINLDAFYACVQAGNFTNAAARLHITQSALSQRVKNLEEELGTTLLLRDRTGLRLTEFGESLLRYCREREEAEHRVLSPLSSKTTGSFVGQISVGAFSTIGRSLVLPAISKLLVDHPKVHFKLVIRELRELSGFLRSGEINYLLSTDEIDLAGVVSKKIGYEANVLVRKRGSNGPAIFLDHDESDRTSSQFFGKSTSALERRYLDDIYGILDGVALGLGMAVAPVHLVDGYQGVEVVDSKKTMKVPVFLSYFERSIPSKLHERTVAILEQILEYNPRQSKLKP